MLNSPISFRALTDAALPAALHWQCQLGVLGQIVTQLDDITQSLHLIATTPRGSVPLLPLFGSDIWQYLDQPIAQATPYVIRDLTLAIAQWEPRINVMQMMPRQLLSQLTVTIDYRLVADGTTQQTRLALQRQGGVQ